MDTYKLRTELRELEEDPGSEDVLHLPKDLRREIEEMTFKLDRATAVCASYRDVLRDILK